MSKTKMAKFALMPAFAVSLIACGGKPSVTEISVKTASAMYSVGDELTKDALVVTATYSDKSTKEIKDGFTVEPNLPYTFKSEDVESGKDFNVTYAEKKGTVHINVVDTPSKDEVKITFKNYDGNDLEIKNVKKGEDIAYSGQMPRKPIQGSEIENVFIGWDKDLGIAKEDETFTTVYKSLDEYIDNDHDGIPKGIDTDDNDNQFDVIANSFVKIDQNISIDFTKFLKADANTHYDNDLAKLGLFMSNPKIDFNDGLFENKVYGGGENALYARLGLDDFHHFDFKDYAANNYKYDPRDTTSGVYGHKYLRDENNNIVKDLIVIAFEGTNGKNRWASNFDVGYDDGVDGNYNKDYYEKAKRTENGETGTREDHPEWDNKDFHKGFYIAAHRVLNETVDGGLQEGPVKFLKYIADHSSKSNGEPIVFVTGHSRGGAMANIVGEYLQNRYNAATGKTCIPFTYAFAAPSVWGSKSQIQANTVFNILNKDDLVTKVPFSGWDFSKIGNTVIDQSAGVYKELYDEGNERKYQWIPSETTEAIFSNLGCKGRDEIYKIDETDESLYISNVAANADTYTSQAAAEAALVTIKADYKDKLGDFSQFVELKVHDDTILAANPKFNIYAHACLGTVTALVGCLMTNDAKVMSNLDYVIPLISNSKFTEMLLSLAFQILPEGADKIALPHDYGAYHIILREYAATENK